MARVNLAKLRRERKEGSLRKFRTPKPPPSVPYDYMTITNIRYTLKLSIDFIHFSQPRTYDPTEKMIRVFLQEQLEDHLKKRFTRRRTTKSENYFTTTYTIPFRGKEYEVESKAPKKGYLPHQLKIMHPTRAFLKSLKHLEYHVVRKVEFTFDFHTEEPAMLMQFLASHVYVKWLGKRFQLNPDTFGDSDYKVRPLKERKSVGRVTFYFGNPRDSRELAGRIYEKLLPKGKDRRKIVCRFEVVRKRPFFQKHNVHTIDDLLALPPIDVLERVEFRKFDFEALSNARSLKTDRQRETAVGNVDWQIKHCGLHAALQEAKRHLTNPKRYTEIHPFDVRRAKLGVASRGEDPAPEALVRHRVPSVA